MAPCEITDDYYAILEVPQTAALEIIKKSYRRLAISLHPDKNPSNPHATASFQCLARAYETVSDPDNRRIYDIQWVRIKLRQSTEQEAKKRQTQAAEAERKRAAEETLNRQRKQKASQERLEQLEQLRLNHDTNIFELNRVIKRLTAEMKRLQNKDDEEAKKERERNSWWTYLTAGKTKETDEQKQQRESERLQRLARKTIKGNDLDRNEVRLRGLRSELQDVNRKIAAEKQKAEDSVRSQAARRQEQLMKEQEAKRRAEEKQEREIRAEREAAQAKSRREAAARTAKEACDAQEAREAREAQERVRRVQAAREAQEARERAARAAETAQRKNASRPATTANSKSTCRHHAFWQQIQGQHLCENCHKFQKRFAFQCPGCKMIACASCRRDLKGERGSSDRNPSRKFDSGSSPDYGDSYDF